ncbi:hypothetical protein [Methylocystis sp. SC2]|uniref:hypothetical protein n=1 Tax=Methylocystis sp. (strain SC2) TaxID=187303 RepID=UPI00027AF104|nr:hypothetical protein [Methylocystis sp. SC2]CCJ07123.1 Hypothetical protein BN69_1672 [Methylocystis sp. SC2]
MKTPHPDDFRIERDGSRIVVTFTPAGKQFAYDADGGELQAGAAAQAEPEQVDYDPLDVERMAAELAGAVIRAH